MQDKIEGVLANRKPLPAGKSCDGVVIELSEQMKAAAAMDGSSAARLEKAAQDAEKPKSQPPTG